MANVNEVTNQDLYNLIQGLVAKSEQIQQQNENLKNELKQEIQSVKNDFSQQLTKITKESLSLREENTVLREKVTVLERKNKKYNLIVNGLEESESEVNDIQGFLDIINNKLQVDCRFADLRDIYRFGKKQAEKHRPLFVELISYKLKIEILNKAKELKGTRIFISHDYTPEDYEQQKVLRKNLAIAKANNCQAFIKKNTLFINGKPFTVDSLKTLQLEEELRKGHIQGAITYPLQQKDNQVASLPLEGNTIANTPDSQSPFAFFTDKENKKRKSSEVELEIPTKRATRQGNKKNII